MRGRGEKKEKKIEMSPWVTVLPNRTEMSLFLEANRQRATFKRAVCHETRRLLWKS